MTSTRSFLREQILALLKESTTSAQEDLEALRQCAAQIRDRAIVGGIAQECGLTLAGFRTDGALELYYNIKHGRHDLGFISKGWEEPGFRLGDLVEIGWWDADLVKVNTPQIMRFCAGRGIALSIQEKPQGVELQLDGVIYSDGFNRETFIQTLDSLNVCVEHIEALLPARCQGSLPPCPGPVSRRLAEASAPAH